MVPDSVIEAMCDAQRRAENDLIDEPLSTRGLMREGMRAALLALESSGWRVVPIEPTEEMIDAGYMKAAIDLVSGEVSEIYTAMLSASPNSK